MTSSYDFRLVALSMVVATLASYTALDLAGRLTAARGRARRFWLVGGASALGIGIWSMHFVGMLAFKLPVAMTYDPWRVLASGLAAIIASAIALQAVSGRDMRIGVLLSAGFAMAAAIAGMHYIGMWAMRVDADLEYSPGLFVLSIIIAIVASIAALWLAFRFRSDDSLLGRWRKGGSAVVMGFAICGMHYTGMAAAVFTPTAGLHNGGMGVEASTVGISIAVSAAIVMALALVGATIDRHAQELGRERERLQSLNEEMDRRVRERTAELRLVLEAAELANRAKSDFLASMSHELRTPLNAVIGFANLLTKNKNGHLQPQELTYVERISVNGHHLLSLINDVLDLAKIEARRTEVVLAPVALDVLVKEVVGQLEAVVRDRPVVLQVEVPATVLTIDTDVDKVRQVLINLIGNALKFTATGSVTVRLVTDVVSGLPERIQVVDTGIGIPSDRLDAIFRPFEQADNSTSRAYGGTGLGLPIARSLCNLLGFRLGVASEVGRGTIFTMELSRTSATRTSPSVSGVRLPNNRGVTPGPLMLTSTPLRVKKAAPEKQPTVLIIEDDPDTCHIIAQYVADAGIRVQTAPNGADALRLLEAGVPDLILLDLEMPQMDGSTFLEHIRRDSRYRDLSVVIVTAHEINVDERERFSRQTVEVVIKGADLESKLENVLGRIIGGLARAKTAA